MRFRSVLVYSTLLGSVAVGAATAGLDPTALRTNLSRWSESACERLRVDLCLHLRPRAETRSEQVASNRRPWTDPPVHDAPVAERSAWRDSDGGHVDAAPSDVATTGGVPSVERAVGDPAGRAAEQGSDVMPLLSNPEAPSIQAETDEPQPASAPAAPVVSSLGVAPPDGSKPDGQLTIGPADVPAAGKAADEDAGAMNPDPESDQAITNSYPPADPEPDLTPVPFPPMRPEAPMQANLADPPPSPASGDTAPTERSDGPNVTPKVEGPNGGGTHDRRRTARRMTGPSVPPSATSRGTIRGSRILARTGQDLGPDQALRPRRPVQLPERLLPDDLP